VTPYPVVHGDSGGPSLAYRIEAKAASSPTAPTRMDGHADPGGARRRPVRAEAYYYDKIVRNHLSLATLEAHLAEIRPKRLC